MMKRLFTTLFIALMSVTAWAEDYPLKINGVTVTSDNAQNLSGISGVSGTVSYDASTSTLTLSGATINGYIVSNVPGLKVKVMGQNTITSPNRYTSIVFQYNSSDVTIFGTGTLNLTSDSYCISYAGGESITIRDCTLNLYGGDEAIDDDGDYGVKLIVDNADLFAQRGNEEPICVTEVELRQCTLTTPDWSDWTYEYHTFKHNGTAWTGDIRIESNGHEQSAEQELTLNTSRYDVSGNGSVTIQDLTLLANALVGRVNFPVTNLYISYTTKGVLKGHYVQLDATFAPTNADYPALRWTTSDARVATVSNTGLVTAKETGTCIITVTTLDGSNLSRSFALTVRELVVEGFVDLGLPSGTLWAACNLGATSPEQAGNYYAWGETSPKTTYKWATYFDTNDGGTTFTTFKNNGGLTVLDAAHDPATALGTGASTPTNAQWVELKNRTSHNWEMHNGVYGRVFTSIMPGYTDQSIFIPAGGYKYENSVNDDAGYYWLKNLDPSDDKQARYILFYKSTIGSGVSMSRFNGFPIRPVYNP